MRTIEQIVEAVEKYYVPQTLDECKGTYCKQCAYAHFDKKIMRSQCAHRKVLTAYRVPSEYKGSMHND